MTRALAEGIFLGITLAFLVGPAFVSLIQTSIHRGFIAGVQFAAGISLSDIMLIALSYIGLLQIFNSNEQYLALGVIGGIIIIVLGIITYNRKYSIPSNINLNLKVKTGRFFKYLSKGFFLNIFNPFLLIFWISVMGLVKTKYLIPSREAHLFLAGCIAAVFSTDLIKVIIARKIKDYLNIKTLTLLNRIVGSMLVLFGVVLIMRVVFFK